MRGVVQSMKSLWRRSRSFISQILMFIILAICLCTALGAIIIYWKWYIAMAVFIVLVIFLEPKDDDDEIEQKITFVRKEGENEV